MTVGTEERLVRAAERLFAARGVAAVSLRAVMQEAGTNVAAVHYHFGSKAALVDAVVRGRRDQITEARDALLDAVEVPDARALALAFIQPVLDLVESGGGDWVRVIGQLLETNDPALTPISETFYERNARFVDLMSRLEPRPDEDTIAFRLTQAMGLTLRVLGDLDRVRALMAGAGAAWTARQVVAQLTDVVTAVLAGPPEGRSD
ncbi:TetR/AcrR family transcriptional regulator [Amycolatopsis acidicola]|uniref:TetR/AcrR family transcriptional regulator n=1 Tax=Amycolatopsis acidicola TaxID=2596893 RepID=A0A5N0VJL9_9PSEU|nr:TetR/AcrR family transcriptional regulator [Amycolatopsis acidicola]KAA9166405.1 TetR/AcrR family transcriptional regulator [Amycolatopsis acidicola]